jgi:NhaP-type Na+/H+ or K+/H+ antiporter
LLGGYAAHAFGRRTHIPRVTLMLLLGAAVGPVGLGAMPTVAEGAFPVVTYLALAMVGFLLGERIAFREMRRNGRGVIGISIGVSIITALLVFVATWAVGATLMVALVLAGVAPATAPAATLDVVRERRAKGPLTDTVLRVVAIDDAWCVILFSVLLVAAEGLQGHRAPVDNLWRALWEVGGAIVLGAAVGVPMAWLTGRLKRGEPTLLEAAGFVFLGAGLALWAEVSYLLASMARSGVCWVGTGVPAPSMRIRTSGNVSAGACCPRPEWRLA